LETCELKLVRTGDGTFTLYSENFGEAMHSDSGAYEEALLKHVRPSSVFDNNKSSVKVLDVGFGMGYNTLALVHEAYRQNREIKIEAVCLEYDNSYSDILFQIKFEDERDEIYSKILQAFSCGHYKSEMLDIRLIFGDARKNIKKITGEFDAIFHDPFSPAKNPELWAVEFFKEEFRLLSSNGLITTYSSSSKIRRGMLEAGLIVGRGPSVGRKKEGTIAGKKEFSAMLSSEEIQKILNNPEAYPYRDPGFLLTREEIAERRIVDIKI
jgi:tRNA U34 5-methylaminomethyl-2-thiouridine-forming methyltransferase MnmC